MEKFIIIDRNDRQILHGPQHLLVDTLKELGTHPDFFYDYFSGLDQDEYEELYASTVSELSDEFKIVEVDDEHLYVCERD